MFLYLNKTKFNQYSNNFSYYHWYIIHMIPPGKF